MRLFFNIAVAALAFLLPLAGRAAEMRLLARDPAESGALYALGSKQVLFAEGTPEQMGTAHGNLLREKMPHVAARTMALIGAGLAFKQGEWFYDRTDEIYRRSSPHTPERFLRECRAMGLAAGVSERDAMAVNFFTELFHCSGAAVRGTATAGGEVIHVRVLDYMRDINLQKYALLQVFIPEDAYPWVSLGYVGFLGTVTAMNDQGLAIGELGGSNPGQWDGMPMNFIMREVVEKAATVPEALELMRGTPRTCEFYYVLSDAQRNMAGVYATPDKFEVLEPGEQSEKLPPVPADTIMMSGGARAKKLSERLHAHHGEITPEIMVEIIKRPVAMRSNLHNAIFMPETLDLWFSDAGAKTPACDEPYTKVNLRELLDFYRKQKTDS